MEGSVDGTTGETDTGADAASAPEGSTSNPDAEGSNPDAGAMADGDASGGSASSGTLGFTLALPGGAVVSSVTYNLVDSSHTAVGLQAAPNPGTANVSGAAFQLGGVPAATGDSVSLTASVSGGGTCQGSASGISVTAGGTTNVTVNMLCSLPGQDAGNLFANSCATWTSLSITNRRFADVHLGEALLRIDSDVQVAHEFAKSSPRPDLAASRAC